MNSESVLFNTPLLEICKNICCDRNDHVICPITLCSEFLHSNTHRKYPP